MPNSAETAARAFRGPAAFRAWLQKHHAEETELLVRCSKAQARGSGLTYRQALDEALCFGWIDGVRRGVDADTFSVRFTPRKPKSRWRTVNIRRVGELQAEGRMHPAGQAAFDARVKSAYSYESRPQVLSPAFLKRFREKPRAWRYYEAQAPWYRRTSAFWVMSAKREETRERRLLVLIASCEKQAAIPALTR